MLSPATILKLWKRVNDRFGPAGEDPKGKGDAKTKVSTKAKQAEKEDTRINKGLTNLRNRARGDLTTPVAAAAFLKSRDVTVKSMHKYCKLLRGNDLKDSVKDLTRFRKAVKQLTVAVAALKVGPFPKEEEQWELNTYVTCEVLGWRGVLNSEERRRRADNDLGYALYLGIPYYGRWILAAARMLVDKNHISLVELVEKIAEVKSRYAKK